MRHIRALSPDIQLHAFYLVYFVRQAGFPLQITSSVRTRAEQDGLVRQGLSRNRSSPHLYGQAFDVDLHGYGRDQVPMWFWQALGQFGEALGFRWGGRWNVLKDFGHFENPRG